MTASSSGEPIVSRADCLIWVEESFAGDVGRVGFEPKALTPVRPSQKIRLWYPVEASDQERAAWRRRLVDTAAGQPFSQVFREQSTLDLDDSASKSTLLFSGIEVEAMSLIGLSRATGWRGECERPSRVMAGRRFSFSTGTSVYPGATGVGITGEFSIEGPEQSLAEVPPRILSEVLRAVDLLVAVGSAGVKDDLHETGAVIDDGYVGARSIEMRKILVAMCYPDAKFEKRWLLLAKNHRIHLGTGLVFERNAIKELSIEPQGEPSLMGSDPILRRVFGAIKEFGLGSLFQAE